MCCSPRAICKQQLLCLFLFFVCSSHSSRVCSLCSLFDQHVSRRLLEHLPSELHYATDQERHAWFSRRLRPSAQGKLVSGPMALDTVWSGRARRSSRYPANRARLGRRRELDARRRPKKLPRAARRSSTSRRGSPLLAGCVLEALAGRPRPVCCTALGGRRPGRRRRSQKGTTPEANTLRL